MARAVDRHLEFTDSAVRKPFATWASLVNVQQSWPTDVKDVEQTMVGIKRTTDWFGQAQLGELGLDQATGHTGFQWKIDDMEPHDDRPFVGMAAGGGGWVKEDSQQSVFQHQDLVPRDWLGTSELRPEGEFPVRPMVAVDPHDPVGAQQAQARDGAI